MTITTEKELRELALFAQKLNNFSKYIINAKPTKQQQKVIDAIDAGEKRIAIKSGHGCFGKGTKILMYDGSIKNVEDVVVGDVVMGDDGTPRNVLELKRGREEMYEFEFNNKEKHIYNKSHYLVLKASQTNSHQRVGDIQEVTVGEWLNWNDEKKRTNCSFKVGVDFEEKAVTVEPYLLGVWLGDGNSRNRKLSINAKDFDEITSAFNVVRKKECRGYYETIIEEITTDDLRKLGVLNNKHIPQHYLINSARNRFELLAGLIDADGYADKVGYEITQKNERLANQIVFLCRSLGLSANVKKVQKKCYNNGKIGVYYRINISRNYWKIPCRVSRKRHTKPKNARRENLNFGIKKVTPLGVGDYYGFTLDGNHRFLGGDFFVLRNTGKTSLLSWITLWAGLTQYDCKIPITAPSSPQLLSTFIPEVRKWRNQLPDFLKEEVNIKLDQVDFLNGNFAVARTARKENPEALQGFHAQRLVFLVDEASGIEESIFEVIDGALTGEHNMMIMTGNPTRTSGFFFKAFNADKELWTGFTFNAEESENVDKKIIERKKKQYGEDSDVYRVRVLGEFPRASSDAIFGVEELEESIKREHFDSSGSEIWGLDIARFGDDRTCLAKRRGFEFYYLGRRENLSTTEVASWIVFEYNHAKNKPSIIFIDTIGIGAGVFDRLNDLGLPVFEANVTSKSAYTEYQNKRAEMYMELKKRIKYIKLPDDDELLGELGAIRYQFNNKNQVALEPKDDTKKRLGRSPDSADAVALTFFEPYFVMEDKALEERISLDDDTPTLQVAW